MDRFSDQVEQDPSQGGTYVWRASTVRREYPGGGSSSNDYRRLHMDQRPPDRGGHPNGGGRPPDRGGHPNGGWRPPDRGGYADGGPLEEDTLMDVGDPLTEENTLVETPNGGGGPPDGGESPRRQGPPGPQGPPGCMRLIIVQIPEVALDTTTQKYV